MTEQEARRLAHSITLGGIVKSATVVSHFVPGQGKVYRLRVTDAHGFLHSFSSAVEYGQWYLAQG